MYTDFLIKLKNAQAVKKENVKLSYSKMDERILGILAKNGYVDGFEKKGRGPKKVLSVKLKYENGEGVINGIKFISKPSRRLYGGYKEMKPVKRGYGLLVVSTPEGIMTGAEAKKTRVGGEFLFEIW